MAQDPVAQLPRLRDVIDTFDLAPKKALGQNFLLDLNLTARIARQVPQLNQQHVVEIGPGPGGLTRAALLEGATRITVIEKDERCLDALAQIQSAAGERLEIIEGDALKIDVLSLGSDEVYLLSNLPYNIATPLTIGWLRQIRNHKRAIRGMTLMYQKEVVDRLCAQPGTKAFGRLAVIAQWLCDVQLAFEVPARAFTPPPKVTSAIAQFLPHPAPLFPANFTSVEQVTSAAFGQRRKMLRSSLKPLVPVPTKLLSAAQIEETLRAEALSLEAFGRLVKQFEAINRTLST